MTEKTSFVRHLLMLVLFLSMSVLSYAQNTFNIKLKLIDAKTAEPVGFATASITPKGSETASQVVMTDDEGKAVLEKM